MRKILWNSTFPMMLVVMVLCGTYLGATTELPRAKSPQPRLLPARNTVAPESRSFEASLDVPLGAEVIAVPSQPEIDKVASNVRPKARPAEPLAANAPAGFVATTSSAAE